MDLGFCITRGWAVFKKDPIPLALGTLLLILAGAICSSVTAVLPLALPLIAGLLLSGLLTGGATVMA